MNVLLMKLYNFFKNNKLNDKIYFILHFLFICPITFVEIYLYPIEK